MATKHEVREKLVTLLSRATGKRDDATGEPINKQKRPQNRKTHSNPANATDNPPDHPNAKANRDRKA